MFPSSAKPLVGCLGLLLIGTSSIGHTADKRSECSATAQPDHPANILRPARPVTTTEIECPKGTLSYSRVIGVGDSDPAAVTELYCWRKRDATRHGPYIARGHGKLLVKGAFKNGLRHGPWFEGGFGPDSQQGNYQQGHRHGLWTSFHAPNTPAWRGRFRCGKPQGLFVWWHPDGSEQQRRQF